LLKRQQHPWIETLLGIKCFDNYNNGSAILIEWLLMQGAQFSENELKKIEADPALKEKTKSVLDVIQSKEKYDFFKEGIEW